MVCSRLCTHIKVSIVCTPALLGALYSATVLLSSFFARFSFTNISCAVPKVLVWFFLHKLCFTLLGPNLQLYDFSLLCLVFGPYFFYLLICSRISAALIITLWCMKIIRWECSELSESKWWRLPIDQWFGSGLPQLCQLSPPHSQLLRIYFSRVFCAGIFFSLNHIILWTFS